MTPPDRADTSGWPGLSVARDEAARRGARSIGTQHVLLALLAGGDHDTTRALDAGDVELSRAIAALRSVVGVGNRTEPLPPATVVVSDRVRRILDDAARPPGPDSRRTIHDRDVLRALLTSDDPAVGQWVVHIISSPERIVEALDNP